MEIDDLDLKKKSFAHLLDIYYSSNNIDSVVSVIEKKPDCILKIGTKSG